MASLIRRLRDRILLGLTKRARLFPLLQRIRGKSTGTFCRPSTDLCIEGYESSANSFTFNVFRLLRPDLQIAHHTHSVANLKRARSYDVPTIILFRSPEEAIPSLVSRFRPGVHEAILRYVYFYGYVCTKTEDVFLVDFEEVTSEFANVVYRFESWSDFSFGSFDPDEVERKVIEHIETWTRERGREDVISLPVEERERRKTKVREALEASSYFREAKELFQQMRTSCQRQNNLIE